MQSVRMRYLPLVFFFFAYMLTCYIGVALLMWGPVDAQSMYRLYSGVDVPQLDARESFHLLMLLHVAPALLALGYVAAIRLLDQHIMRVEFASRPISDQAIRGLWITSVLAGCLSLWHGGGFDNASAWLASYDSWVLARWRLFATLSVPEFINLYVFLPVTSSLLVLSLWRSHRTYAVLVFLVGLAVTLFLFQKKQPIVYTILVLLPFGIGGLTEVSRKPWWKGKALRVSGALVAAYLALVFVPTLGLTDLDNGELLRGSQGEHAEALGQVERTDLDNGESLQGRRAERAKALGQVEQMAFTERYLSVGVIARSALFATNSIVYRTSAPAIFYPYVFPDRFPYYGMDLPFDGFTPDDNRLVWKVMWPDTPGGSVMVPFQFALFAQVGLAGALLLSAATGLLLGLAWSLVLRLQAMGPALKVLGALTLVFALFLATDSVRNSVISSYGLAWGVLLILGLLLASRSLYYTGHQRT